MSHPLKARAIEAALGGGVGALGGAALGGLTYTPETPTEWLDENDVVQARKYTPEEKRERGSRAMKAALMVAALGGAGSLGASAIRRGLITSAERAKAPEWESNYLEGLRKIVRDRSEAASIAKATGNPTRTRRTEERAGKSMRLLAEEEQLMKGMLGEAAEARRGRPWGGFLGGTETMYPHEELTHEGRIARHFEELRKKHNLPPLMPQEWDPQSKELIGERFFKELLEKQSHVTRMAFFEELRAIAEV